MTQTLESSVNDQLEASSAGFDVARIRRDFPILHQTINGKPLVYFDNAASAQKPQAVLDAIQRYYSHDHANIHRGVHELSMRATKAYEDARVKVQQLINAPRHEEIIFVRGTTEAINLVAHTFGRVNVAKGDEVLITTMEHHSNIVPWQILCEQVGALLRVAPISDEGELPLQEFKKMLGSRTKLVAVTHVSNAIGTINPIREIVALAHAEGVPVFVDGAQAVPHLKVDVQQLGCDFYAFSGHKFFGPTGIGILYGKLDLLNAMPPYEGGGEMIKSVTFEKTVYNDVPHKFEAGTPNIAGSVGLAATIDYINTVGLENIAAHENDLLEYATDLLSAIPQVRLIGTARHKAAVISFVVEGVHPHDVGTILDQQGIAIRTGHHCAQPLMARYDVPATCRASFAFYNTRDEIDAMMAGLKEVVKVFS